MPLLPGKSHFSGNVSELMHKYKRTGKIGKTHPKSKAKARRIALAIAYKEMKGGH